ncbi:MAG: PfkB family carbohydrate kinase [Candidatus Izemoplasmatales bacterium]|nr:PfkB family carbohydrate kinase [Candidatus Izemoplasmatales bacterium]MDD5601785.1 PfkB family carbohydrate kinase [Candidatus Izemoplasmatales bacterium]NLF48897.1 sugar kinase [Acholeplasmataceae bacterium]
MTFREHARYAILVPSSMGVRITPNDRQPVHISTGFHMQATSAETNVISISAALGLKVKVLTKFVKMSPIAQFIKNDLRRRGIEFEGKEIPQGGPWGYRHQFNIADSGYGLRAPQVQNDRAGEVGKTLNIQDFDLDRLFQREGVALLHLSGLIAALSPNTGAFCLELARKAKQSGTKISFDLNYRASFWEERQSELRQLFTELAGCADFLIGNEEDFQLALGLTGPASGGKNLLDQTANFKEMILKAKQAYPKVELFATTLREVVNANEHLWGAIMLADDQWIQIEPRLIQVMDRIGGGDGFVGGLLYGLLKGYSLTESLQLAWASGAYVVTLLDDFGLPLNEEQLWRIYEGNARVKR